VYAFIYVAIMMSTGSLWCNSLGSHCTAV